MNLCEIGLNTLLENPTFQKKIFLSRSVFSYLYFFLPIEEVEISNQMSKICFLSNPFPYVYIKSYNMHTLLPSPTKNTLKRAPWKQMNKLNPVKNKCKQKHKKIMRNYLVTIHKMILYPFINIIQLIWFYLFRWLWGYTPNPFELRYSFFFKIKYSLWESNDTAVRKYLKRTNHKNLIWKLFSTASYSDRCQERIPWKITRQRFSQNS